EEISRTVQQCLAKRGYSLIETPTLEVMDVMRAGGRMPGTPFKFFDSQGDLLAMRPDVTLQIARMCATRLKDQAGPFRFRYMQRVFRETESEMQAAARELTQIGTELIGESGPSADAEMIGVFAEALRVFQIDGFKLAIGTVGVLRVLLEKSGASDEWKDAILAAYHMSNFVDLDMLCANPAIDRAFAEAIAALPRIRGGREAIESVRLLVTPLDCVDGLDALEETYDLLCEQGLDANITIDFSVMSSFDYYTGIVVEAYAPGLGSPLGSGGRYDNMLAGYGQNRPAAGFAFFLEQAMAAAQMGNQEYKRQATPASGSARPLRIAVPKGSLNADTIAVLAAAGLDTTGLENPGRQLIISNPGVDFIIVRPTDAPVFVALGAADCGICGKDSLVEADPDVVELVDLTFGACRFIVAEPGDCPGAADEHYRRSGSIRVATKYPNITAAYYAKIGMQVEIVKLHGNIELAPLTGMAERIVDITATGTTLHENNLVIVDEVLASTARFFANTCAFRTDARIVELTQALQKA
ncbi:MAG: ATP phosphoribosyltransferase regulatory subunit, partial [Raoultibacter sp.]